MARIILNASVISASTITDIAYKSMSFKILGDYYNLLSDYSTQRINRSSDQLVMLENPVVCRFPSDEKSSRRFE